MLRHLRQGIARLAAAFRRGRLDDEFQEEIREHLELRRRQLMDDGMDPRDASFEARRMFGNVTSIREETRDMWGFRTLDTLLQDLRYGARMLRRTPLVTLVAIASLAIGIGAAAAVFSLFDRLLFQKLPVRAPDELIVFRWRSGPVQSFESLNGTGSYNEEGYSSTSFSRTAFEHMHRALARKAELFGFADLYRVNIAVDGRPEKGDGQAVSGNYFSALALVPASGRLISDSDDRPGATPVAVIGYDYWQRRFGGADVAGRPLVLNGFPVTIVGVAPRGFHGTLQVAEGHDVIVPLSVYASVTRWGDTENPNYWWLLMMGRLKPGVRPEHVQADADVIFKQTVAAARPQQTAKDLPRLAVEPGARGQTEDRDRMREPLTTMAFVVGIVLLVACANVANLLLARGRARVRELAVRAAIGASRSRVIRQLLTEGFLLSAIGSALGLLFATSVAASLLPAVGLTASSYAAGGGLDARVVAFTLLLGSACSLLFGLAPALRATDVRLAASLQESSRSASGPRLRGRLAGGLVIVQVALSMLLVTAATLLVYSVRNLTRVDPGFQPEGILLFRVDPKQNGYNDQRARNLYSVALDRLAALPGVRSASLMSHMLISGASSFGVARRAGTPAPNRDSPDARKFIEQNRAYRLVVDDGFFSTFRIPMMAGRTFGSGDTDKGQPVAVVNASMARQLFGTTDALGRRLVLGLGDREPEIEVVGICADAKYTSVRRQAPPTVYLSYRQRPLESATFAVRADDPAGIVEPVREAMRQVDAALPLYEVVTQSQQIVNSLRRERFFARLATLLGSVTLLLATIGLYGLLAYSVTRRTPEIGVRMALGAGRGTVRWMVLRQSLALVVVGLALGVPGAIAGSRVVESMLFGLSPTNPAALAGAAGLMLVISLAASFVPAQRAARVDPIVALRAD
jgi:predicted permease